MPIIKQNGQNGLLSPVRRPAPHLLALCFHFVLFFSFSYRAATHLTGNRSRPFLDNRLKNPRTRLADWYQSASPTLFMFYLMFLNSSQRVGRRIVLTVPVSRFVWVHAMKSRR